MTKQDKRGMRRAFAAHALAGAPWLRIAGAVLLVACSRAPSAPGGSVALDLRMSLPPLPRGDGLSLQDEGTTAPVALLLRVKGDDGVWQERTLEPGQSSASFDVLPGNVDVEARYVAGRIGAGASIGSGASSAPGGASATERFAVLRERACVSPADIGYLVGKGQKSQVVSEEARVVSVVVGSLVGVPLVPGGAVVKLKGGAGLANAPGVRLQPLDPQWGIPLPSACPGQAIGAATTNEAGLASLRLPVFPDNGGIVSFRYATASGSGHAALPSPSLGNLRENLHRVVLDGATAGLALVERPTDPIKEFGPAFFAELTGPLDASRICKGTTLMGIAGAAVCDVTPAPKACLADGETNCVASGGFAAAATSGLASKVLSGQSVAGVFGTAPSRPADCAIDGATGCVATVGFPAVNGMMLTAGIIKKGHTLGSIVGDYPSAAYPLAGATTTTDLPTLSSSMPAGSYEYFDSSGSRLTGVVADVAGISIGGASQVFVGSALYRGFTIPGDPNLTPGNIASGVSIFGVTGLAAVRPSDCNSDGQINCVAVSAFKAADMAGLASKVLSTQTVAGVPGNVILPSANVVRSGSAFGPGGGSSGTLVDCTADGASGCYVPSGTSIRAADTSNFKEWDIRRKRGAGGALLTFGGFTGALRTCRNRARTNVFDNTTAPAVSGLDILDSIDDYNNAATPLPPEVPPWLISGVPGDPRNDFACGGIFATGNTTAGNTGADSSMAHDPNGNWQDLTPGVKPGGVASTNATDGCNANDKFCVFREAMSGLMVTEYSASAFSWQGAVGYCDTLGEAAHPLTILRSPIPVFGGNAFSDWRLPTQKELLHLYNAGIRGLGASSALQAYFGAPVAVWSSTTASFSTSAAWWTTLEDGTTGNYLKTDPFKVICVR